jgi:hypothetical protein
MPSLLERLNSLFLWVVHCLHIDFLLSKNWLGSVIPQAQHLISPLWRTTLGGILDGIPGRQVYVVLRIRIRIESEYA